MASIEHPACAQRRLRRAHGEAMRACRPLPCASTITPTIIGPQAGAVTACYRPQGGTIMPDYSRYETLTIDVGDHVATVTLNRPERLNAVNDQMHRELEELFGEISSDD